MAKTSLRTTRRKTEKEELIPNPYRKAVTKHVLSGKKKALALGDQIKNPT